MKDGQKRGGGDVAKDRHRAILETAARLICERGYDGTSIQEIAHERAGAEIALTVADAFQRIGVGRILRDALVDAARARRIGAFRAHVLPGNRGMRRLLAAPSLDWVGEGAGVIEVRLVDGRATK